MRVTAKQIAKDLGISEATVSLVFNNKPGVSEQMQRRVNTYADELRRKSEIAINYNNSNIKVISLLSKRYLYDKDTVSFYTVIMMEITKIANSAGYNIISVFAHNIEEIKNTIEQSRHDRTCGFILHAADMTDEQIRLFSMQEIPTVVCDYESDDIDMDYIYFNNKQAVNLALRHLFDMGHRDIVYFYNSEQIYNFLIRRETFEYNIQKRGQPVSMIEMGTKIEEIYSNIVQYIEGTPKMPTAVLSENYAISVATIKAFQDCGYKIGKDISIIGIDELPFHMLMDFEFTYVKVMFKSKGYFTIKRLLEKIDDKRKDIARIVIDNTLIVGNSVCRIT